MVAFPRNGASAAIALSRAFSRAVAAGGALTIAVHDVLTVIPHYAAFYHAIGTELGAPAALGLLLEAVRAALNSPTATLSLGNVAAASDRGWYGDFKKSELHKMTHTSQKIYCLVITKRPRSLKNETLKPRKAGLQVLFFLL